MKYVLVDEANPCGTCLGDVLHKAFRDKFPVLHEDILLLNQKPRHCPLIGTRQQTGNHNKRLPLRQKIPYVHRCEVKRFQFFLSHFSRIHKS